MKTSHKSLFDHFWRWVADDLFGESVIIPLLEVSGYLQVEHIRSHVCFNISMEFIEGGHWFERHDSYFVTEKEVRQLHEKYYRLKASAPKAGCYLHRRMSTYVGDKDPGALHFVSVIAFYDTMVRKTPSMLKALNGFKPYSQASIKKFLAGAAG